MNIYKSINKIMAQIGAIGKDTKNQQQGFMYRGIDAVMNAINPALVANEVFVVPTVLEQTREERTNSKGTLLIYSICKIKFTFYAEDGSYVEAITIGEGMDTGDKATNKAMSIAFKYACFQVFCIPTEEMIDPDAECHEVKPKEKKQDKKTEPEVFPDNSPIDANMKLAVIKEFNRTGADREKCLAPLGKTTVDELTVAEYHQLMDWFKKKPTKE